MSAVVITIAQRTGGSGKTTLAAHLAVSWAAANRGVALVDTDPQGSLTKWYEKRIARLGHTATRLDFLSAPGPRGAGEIYRRSRTHEIVLVDSPANAGAEVQAAIGEAGLVLVPVQPSPVDVWATVPTLELAQQERVPALLVLNRIPARAGLTATMRQQLAAYDVGLACNGIGNRIVLAASFNDGWGVSESDRHSTAADEIAALAREVLTLLPLAA